MPRRADLRVLWLALILGLFASPAGAARAWRLYLGGTNLTGPAAPVPSGSVPTVNAVLLGPALGLSVRAAAGELILVDRKGMTWHGIHNAVSLEGQGRQLALDSPLQIHGNAAYLPVTTLAELAELDLTLDRDESRILLQDPHHPSDAPPPALETPSAPADRDGDSTPEASKKRQESENGKDGASTSPNETSPPSTTLNGSAGNSIDPSVRNGGGWQPLVVKKSADEIADSLPEFHTETPQGRGRGSDVVAPPASDSLRLGLGLGYVQGADYGLNLNASGGVSGLRVQADGLLTQGRGGFQLNNGRLAFGDGSRKWGVEIGDLPTEVWGARRGFRYSFKRGGSRRPALSLYLPGGGGSRSGLALSYSDELRLGRSAALAGEVTSSGSYMLRSQFQSGNRVNLFGYTRGGTQKEYGLLGSYRITRETTLYGSLTKSLDRGTGYRQSTLGLRVPLNRGIDFTLESSLMRTDTDRSLTHSAMLGAPVGPFRLYTRYEWGGRRITIGEGPSLFPEVRSRNWTAILLFPTGGRLHLDYQMRKSWGGNGSGQTWDQVMATYRLNPKTSLQVISGFPDLGKPDQLHLRLDREIRRDLNLNVDYGRLSPYQSSTRSGQDKGFSFLLSKKWNMSTPARGGTLRGKALDQRGSPVPNVMIRCGPYSARTDREGRYVLKNLPADTYEVYLDENSLPADYRMKEERRQVRIHGKKKQQVDFTVIPLSTLSGTVFEDRNGNSKADPGEGVKGAVVELEGFVTATDANGQYAFYNLEPGARAVRLDGSHLPTGVMPAGPTEASVEMKPRQPVDGVNFQVKPFEKEIIFQDMPIGGTGGEWK